MGTQFNSALTTVQGWLEVIGPYGWLRALIIVIVAFLGARIVEKVIVGTVGRLVKRTRTDFDDAVIAGLHRPIFVSLFITGLVAATRQLELGAGLTNITTAALATIAVVVWLGFAIVSALALLINWILVSIFNVTFVDAQALIYQYLVTLGLYPVLCWFFLRWQQAFLSTE